MLTQTAAADQRSRSSSGVPDLSGCRSAPAQGSVPHSWLQMSATFSIINLVWARLYSNPQVSQVLCASLFYATGSNPAAADWFRPADFPSFVWLFLPLCSFEFTACFLEKKVQFDSTVTLFSSSSTEHTHSASHDLSLFSFSSKLRSDAFVRLMLYSFGVPLKSVPRTVWIKKDNTTRIICTLQKVL